MNKAKYFSFASAVSTLEQSDIFISVKLRILEAPKANLNGARVTEAFIDDIIAHEERYVGLPLYADKKALLSGNYNHLGHMYNQKTGEFYSTQIGSFYQFEKENFDDGCYLVGYARIPKRDKELSKAITDLFVDGSLKFSFEIASGDLKELEDGTVEIDASENNYLEGTAIVTFPACEDAVALELVAQHEAGNQKGGETEMAEVENKEVQTVNETVNDTNELLEPVTAETQPETQTATQTETQAEAQTETATVYVREEHKEELSTSAFDSETGKEIHQSVEVQTMTFQPVEGNLVETTDGPAVAETTDSPAIAETEETTDNSTEETTEEPAAEPVDNTPAAAETQPELQANNVSDSAPDTVATESTETVPDAKEKKIASEDVIAELFEAVKALSEEVKALREQKVTASVTQAVVGEVNPFVDPINAKGDLYDLLQPIERSNGFDLLTR